MDTAKYKELLVNKKNVLSELAATGKAATKTVELDQARVGRLSRMDAMQCKAKPWPLRLIAEDKLNCNE